MFRPGAYMDKQGTSARGGKGGQKGMGCLSAVPLPSLAGGVAWDQEPGLPLNPPCAATLSVLRCSSSLVVSC